jgi:hypothetical protein
VPPASLIANRGAKTTWLALPKIGCFVEHLH